MARYPDLKSSGNVFLGKVPVHWKVESLRNLASVKSIKNCADKELLSVYLHLGVVKFKDIEQKRTNATSDNLTNYQLVEPGDFVLNNQQAWRGSVGVSKHEGIVSPAYLVLKLCDELDPSYSNWLLRDRAMVAQYLVSSKGVGTIQRNLYWPHLKYAKTIVPPLSEQQKIASYLQAQDAHIARFIKAKRELIGLLTEQKLRIIDHAVTRGLDTSVALKPSGIEWLGYVPEHWEVMPLKRACVRSALYGANVPATHYTDIGVRFLRTTDILESGQLKLGGVFLPNRMVRDYILADGDILVSRSGTIGRSFLYRADRHGQCSYAGYLVRFSPSELLHPDFLFCFTKTRAFADFIKLNAISTTIENLNGDKYAKMAVPLPPLEEQRTICRWINDECRPLDDAITRAEEEIKLIREYRDRQIADVVTGQVDVRAWAPGPDDVVTEEDLTALTGDEEIDIDGEGDDGDD